MTDTPPPSTGAYAAAGVDIDAADKAVDLMKAWVQKTDRPEVIGSSAGSPASSTPRP